MMWSGPPQVYEALQRGSVHEALICTAGYVLGDYGNTLKGVPPAELFGLLQERFPSMPPHAKGILLSAYLKLCLMAPQDAQLKEAVGPFMPHMHDSRPSFPPPPSLFLKTTCSSRRLQN